jgi:hypothetical protein
MAHIDETVPETERGDMLIFLSGINEVSDDEEQRKDTNTCYVGK